MRSRPCGRVQLLVLAFELCLRDAGCHAVEADEDQAVGGALADGEDDVLDLVEALLHVGRGDPDDLLGVDADALAALVVVRALGAVEDEDAPAPLRLRAQVVQQRGLGAALLTIHVGDGADRDTVAPDGEVQRGTHEKEPRGS